MDARTTLLTTVHALQVLKGDIPMTTHDVPVDIVVTPERVIRTRTAFDKPAGIRWEELGADQLDAVPVLRRLRPQLYGRMPLSARAVPPSYPGQARTAMIFSQSVAC